MRAFTQSLDAPLDLPILLWAQRLSTFAADESAARAGGHGENRAWMRDALAASWLQD